MTGTPGTLTVEAKALAPLGLPAEGRLLQFPPVAMEAAKPGSRSRSTKGFCGWSGPARSAPPVRPSAQPFSPPPRSTDGAHTDRSGPNRLRASPPPCQTQGDAHEATRSGIARPGGRRKSLGRETLLFRSSGYRASIRRPKPPGPPNNGTPEHPQTL